MSWLGLVLFILILAMIYTIPARLEKRRQPMDADQRIDAPGKFASLSQGLTHYRWVGPVRGPVAVMIHGLTTSSPVWKDTAESMAEIGYRVLVYDLYNRGYSDSVDGPHDLQLYLTQLDDLMADQGLQEDLTIVGYSMGAMIATEFAATEPHRMQRLIMLAPAGVETAESDFITFCRNKRFLGDWWYGLLASRRAAESLRADTAAQAQPHIREARERDHHRQGFFPAVLACYRNVLSLKQERQHRSISGDRIPTITIWGGEDSVIPSAAVGKLAQWNRKAHHEVIEGAGHELPYSHAKEVSEVLRKMLRESKI